jgi:hypothetical protein
MAAPSCNACQHRCNGRDPPRNASLVHTRTAAGSHEWPALSWIDLDYLGFSSPAVGGTDGGGVGTAVGGAVGGGVGGVVGAGVGLGVGAAVRIEIAHSDTHTTPTPHRPAAAARCALKPAATTAKGSAQ